MRHAQVAADKTDTEVPVQFCGYNTVVKPNLPKFSRYDLEFHYKDALKGILAKKMSRPMPIEVHLTSEDDDDDELEELSQSILKPQRLNERKQVIQNIFFLFFMNSRNFFKLHFFFRIRGTFSDYIFFL